MNLSLYFHIPFCTKKCPYCHFYVAPNREADFELLEGALLQEIENNRSSFEKKEIASIYFGGGTPSLFPVHRLEKILQKLPKAKEITLECNPEQNSLSLFQSFLSIGINRLSIGVQSLDDTLLKKIGRTHSKKEAKDAVLNAALAGFQNISIDLMYDLPSQTLESWQKTLEEISSLPIQHLSLYNMTIEPGSTFFRKPPSQPTSDISLQFLQQGFEAFVARNLHRYEISAFAKPGFASIHNTGYWTARPFLGMGPSAFSYMDGRRFQNTPSLKVYAKNIREGKSPVHFEETLESPRREKELFAIHLRLLEGVEEHRFPTLEKEIHSLEKEGFIERKQGRIKLSEKGLLFYDIVGSMIM